MAVAAACITSAVALSACDGGVTGTYTLKVSPADLQHNIDAGAFLIMEGSDSYIEDTLTLNEDGSYVLVKSWDSGTPAAESLAGMGYTEADADNVRGSATYTYYGTYTDEGGKVVTLGTPTSIDIVETWGAGYTALGYLQNVDVKGVTDTSTVYNYCNAFNSFQGQYVNTVLGGSAAQQVKLSGSSFSFVEVVEDDD